MTESQWLTVMNVMFPWGALAIFVALVWWIDPWGDGR